MKFLEKYEHKRLTLREALKYAEEKKSHLASISELVKEFPPELQVLGPVCSGTIIAFMLQKSGPRARTGGSFYSGNEQKWINLDFEFAGRNHAQGECYLMPPGGYNVKQTKSSIVFTASKEFVHAYQRFDIGKRRFYILTTDRSVNDHEIRLERLSLEKEYAGPILMVTKGERRKFLPFGASLSPFDEYNFFIAKQK